MIGADPSAIGRKSRSQRAAGTGIQLGTHLARNGPSMLIEDQSLSPEDHVEAARALEHPLDCPTDIPIDMQFAARISSEDPSGADRMRAMKLTRLLQLVARTKSMDKDIVSRMASSVKVAAGTLKLGQLTVLTLILRWPDWQMTSLFTRGFSVADLVEPSNIYPKTAQIETSPGHGSVDHLLDPKEADKWNQKVSRDLKGSELDTSVRQTAQTQSLAKLLSKPLTKKEVDKIFGK